MTRSLTPLACFALAASLIYTPPAFAYLDPGTGSMMLQALLGGIAGALVVGKLYWHRLKQFVSSRLLSKQHGAGASPGSRGKAPLE